MSARHLFFSLTSMLLEQALRQQRMAEGAAGAHRRRNQCGFRHFLARSPRLRGLRRMHVEAISTLRGERDRERDQLAIFWRDQSILAFDGMIERQERVG